MSTEQSDPKKPDEKATQDGAQSGDKSAAAQTTPETPQEAQSAAVSRAVHPNPKTESAAKKPLQPPAPKPAEQGDEANKIATGSRQERLLAQSVVLEESGLSKLLRTAAVAVSAAVLLSFAWANWAQMDEVARTTGEIAPSDHIQFAQHLEGGIVGKIMVAEGDRIPKGAPLVVMESEDVTAEYNQMRTREAILALQVAQKNALLNGEPIDLADIHIKEFTPLVAEAIDFLDTQRTALKSQRAVIETQLAQKKMKLRKLLDQSSAYRTQLSYYDQELAVRKPLTQSRLMSRLQTLSAQQSRENTRADLLESEGDVRVTRLELEETRQRLREMEDTFFQDAMREMDGAMSELAQIRASLPRLKDRLDRLTVRSPVDGVIKEVKVPGLGAVIPPGGEIAEIVPLEDIQLVEARINTKDVGHVKTGQAVTVKVSTYDYARYGGIEGVLTAISPSTFMDEAGGDPYYKGTIQLSQNYVGGDPNKNLLLPGMTVEASIHTGSKTLMEYILKPIYASVNESFRER
uniref:Membrane fusion protein (MFP) family protein n=1 Tax=Magnetococcus massalia (strain MO-1) TaxID=451514 RepID=A0A1S7LC09_MAGMO|nr:Putative type I secretion membrane fusion protein, HlyD family [Candidatus Magnetococcus massalia]